MAEPPVTGDLADTHGEPKRSNLGFPVVGIGASAGGLGAAMSFFEHMPDRPDMAFVVILHLSPEHESQAAEILQRCTRMPVLQVTATVSIEANHVYVIAPALQLTMSDGKLMVDVASGPRGRPIAIDVFFRTLAHAHRERAIAIVLSGSGSDGALGVAAIKGEGGVAIAQMPGDAEHEGMPAAAIATDQVDFVLPVIEIPDKLAELWRNARHIQIPDAGEAGLSASAPREDDAALAEHALQEIMAILAARTGSDFRHYKRGTVLRRLERRLQVTRQPNLQAYRQYLDNHPQETGHLLQDMLISVTSFFRDRAAFESLEREVLSSFRKGELPAQVRAWSVGCATGEEAYSLAMLLTDHLSPSAAVSVQVFATDVDERALGVARAGQYPESILTDVPPVRLDRYFDRTEAGYRVKKALREQVMFARQNILRDPAFSRIDIIACRNLLMYLDREVQAAVLEIFHFALNPGGLLFLGTAETADFLPDHFKVIDKKNRIYRVNPLRQARRDAPPWRPFALAMAMPQVYDVPPLARAPLAQLHQRLLEARSPASVMIDANRRILHISPGGSRYLRYADGLPSQDLLDAVLPELVSALRAALLMIERTGRRVATWPVPIPGEQQPIVVQMTVRSGEGGGRGDPMLVTFEEVDVVLAADTAGAATAEPAYHLLEDELQRMQDRLEGTIGDSPVSSEALRASNEELQSMNEELRSATEELETSKEELQSVNEELTTVNFELKAKVEETAKANDDLSNLISSMNMATVFVDRTLHIRGFTPMANQLFNIRQSDMGRPLQDLTHRLRYDALETDVAQVIAMLRPVEREIATVDGGRWYLLRVTAYRTNEDRIDGAVLNFIDITERHAVQRELRASDERLRLVAESTEDYAMITVDVEGSITGWNTGARLMFGYTADEIVGTRFNVLFVPEDRAAGQPEYELQQAARHGRSLDERWHMRKDGSRFYCSGITTPMVGQSGIEGFAKIARDLTERQLFERQREELLQKEQQVRLQLEAANALRSEFLAVMSHELKNPLNLILMSAELIGRAPEVEAEPDLTRAVDTIRRTVNSQSQIIDDLLDLSRLTTGKMALNRCAMRWQPVLERIVEALQADARSRELTLAVEAEDSVIFADAVRVEQIVWNLVSNALKFTPAGGTITLRLGREDGYARLDVIDTGRGIEPDFIARVFDMFEQGDRRSATRRNKGLGIGLALVKSLVDLHNGTVEVASDGLGAGATFTVRLPIFEGNWSADPATASSGVNPLAERRVLLVDDDGEFLQAFATLLEKTGAYVTTANDAQSALAQAEAGHFDFVISDIAMPDMDGRQLVERLRQLPHAARWPAIAVSGFGRAEDVERSKAAGFDAHLNKPLSLELLRETLLQLSLRRDA